MQLVGFLLEYEQVRLNRSMFHRSFYPVSNSFRDYCPYQLHIIRYSTHYIRLLKYGVVVVVVIFIFASICKIVKTKLHSDSENGV